MDVDAYTEQLNGLVSLLQAVGIDTVDNSELKRASISLHDQGAGAAVVFPEEIGHDEARQLNDDQIEAMIAKLQQAQAQAPQLMAALEEHVEERQGGKKVKKKGSREAQASVEQSEFMQAYQQQTKKQLGYHQQQRRPSHQNPKQKQEKKQPKIHHAHKHHSRVHPQQNQPEQNPQRYQQEQPDHDDFDEEEDEDEFDEDADYPMVGHGVSDDVSVVSDMTTPTVVSCLNIADEEHYNDILPPMIIGGSGGGPPMVIQPPKRKNLVGGGGANSRLPGGKLAPPRVGGAAAQRRRNYQETMARLQQNPYGMTMVGPAAVTPIATSFTPQFSDVEHAFSSADDIRTKKTPSRSKSGGRIEKEPRRTGKTPARTKSAGNHKSSRSSDPLANDSFHSFNTTPDNWMPFGDDLSTGGDGSVSESQSVKSSGKKRGLKTNSSKGAKSGSKRDSKSNTTSIDRDGFLLDASDPFGLAPSPAKTLRGRDTMGGSGSVHSTQSENSGKPRKKVVKKKLTKNPDGERQPTTSSAKLKKTGNSKVASHQPAGTSTKPGRRTIAPGD